VQVLETARVSSSILVSKSKEQAFRDLMTRCPESPLKKEAQAFLAFQGVKTSESIQDLEAFSNRYPDTEYAASARERMELFSYRQAKSTGSMDALKAFLAAYSSSRHARAAQDQLYAANPAVNFSPQKYFLFKLTHPNSSDMSRWDDAQWILANHKREKHGPLDFSAIQTTNGAVADAVALFLTAYFSQGKDFRSYVSAVDQIKENDAWLKLIMPRSRFAAGAVKKRRERRPG
jgi:hypothetical protein